MAPGLVDVLIADPVLASRTMNLLTSIAIRNWSVRQSSPSPPQIARHAIASNSAHQIDELSDVTPHAKPDRACEDVSVATKRACL